MFQRFHEKLQEREGGFTLIELLVVILIIAILAAIAIPVFLSQREKGWVAQAESALKNAATANESVLVDSGAYASADAAGLTLLETEGFKKAAPVTVSVEAADGAKSYCLEATHTDLTDTYVYNSAVGTPEIGTCS